MVYKETLKEMDYEIKADRSHAQILLKLTDYSRSDEEAVKIIEDIGLQVIDKAYLSAHLMLLKLNVKDMRNVALKLTEHGFLVKGINALP